MESNTAEQPARRRGRPSRGKAAEIHKDIIRIAQNDATLSQQSVADEAGVSRRTVSEVLAKYSINQDELEDYRANQADILLGLQKRISKSISDEEIKKAPFRDKIVAAGILYDKYRLQTNQSTQNVASLHSIADRAIKAVSTSNPPSGDDATTNQDG
jgi:DNA invertase Pin-like site-specific DNA recombinase